NDRQFVRFPRVGNALRDERLAERDAVEEAQGAHDLIEPRPRNARRHQVNLESADVFQFQLIRRSAKIPAELQNRADVGLLRRWRKIADCHVLNHATAKRAHLGHLITSWLSGGLQHPHPLRQEALRATSPSRRGSGFVQSPNRICKETSRHTPQTGKFDYFVTSNQSVRSMASEFFTAD